MKFLTIKSQDKTYIIKFSNLTWKDALLIDQSAYSNGTYNGEKEIRETLQLSISEVEIESCNDQLIQRYPRPDCIKCLDPDWTNQLWEFYLDNFTLLPMHAAELFEQAKLYFNNQAQGKGIDPIILEVDFMTKGILSISREEFNFLSQLELDKIKIVLSAKQSTIQKEEKEVDSLQSKFSKAFNY